MVRGALLLGAALLVPVNAVAAEETEPPEPVILGTGARAVFLRNVHERIHPIWVDSILRNAGARLPASHPLNDRKRSAAVTITLIPDGTVVGIDLQQSSGSREFDAAALGVVADNVLPQPPEESLSDDSRAYLRLVLAADQRKCSGLSVVFKEAPLDEALGRLIERRRDREALRRVRVAGPAALEGAVTTLARLWLERVFDQTSNAVPAAIGLAAVGDTRGADVLRGALERGERVEPVTAALMRLKVAIPPATHRPGPPAPPAAERLSSAELVKTLRTGERPARLAAAAALFNRGDGAARQALAALARDADPHLRLFGATGLGPRERAELMDAVGSSGKEAYRTLVRGPARPLAGQWLVAAFDKLTSAEQIEALSDWLWGKREASPVTLSVR